MKNILLLILVMMPLVIGCLGGGNEADPEKAKEIDTAETRKMQDSLKKADSTLVMDTSISYSEFTIDAIGPSNYYFPQGTVLISYQTLELLQEIEKRKSGQ